MLPSKLPTGDTPSDRAIEGSPDHCAGTFDTPDSLAFRGLTFSGFPSGVIVMDAGSIDLGGSQLVEDSPGHEHIVRPLPETTLRLPEISATVANQFENAAGLDLLCGAAWLRDRRLRAGRLSSAGRLLPGRRIARTNLSFVAILARTSPAPAVPRPSPAS